MKTFAAVRRYVQLALHALLGDISFSWRPPQWLRRTGQGVARRPVISLLACLALAWRLGWRLVPLERLEEPAAAAPDRLDRTSTGSG